MKARRAAGPLLAALTIIVLSAVVLPAVAAAESAAAVEDVAVQPLVVPARAALNELLSGARGYPLESLEVEDFVHALGLASVATLEEEHVGRSVGLSWSVPGLGHLVNGERGAAFAFVAADLAIGVATIIAGSVLLPAAVRSENLDYLQSSFAAIDERWKSVTPAELVPSAAVVISGALLSLSVRAFAAADAERAAHAALRAGTVRFEPQPLAVFGR